MSLEVPEFAAMLPDLGACHATTMASALVLERPHASH